VLTASLLLGARNDGCSFSLGPNGLCARLRLGTDRSTLRVGEQLRIEVNADGCTSAAGCPCLDQALAASRWRSAIPATAQVSADGVVRGLKPGVTDILLLPGPDAAWPRVATRITVIP